VRSQLSDEEKLGRRHTSFAFRELQRENTRYALGQLREYQLQPDAPKAAIRFAITDYERRLDRLEAAEYDRLAANKVQRLEYERQILDVKARALHYEREAIDDTLAKGLISRDTARHLRDNVALIEIDIEDQME